MLFITNIVKYYKLIFYNIFMLDSSTLGQNINGQETINPRVYTWQQIEIKKSVNNIYLFHNKKDRIIYNLSKIWFFVTSKDIQVDTAILSDNVIKETYSPDESHIHIAPMLSTKAMFDMIWLDINSLKSKNVTDIWWWFTALPFELQNIVNSLEIVDPCFDWNIERLINTDISRLEEFIISTKKSLEEKKNNLKRLNQELDEFEFDYSWKWRSISFNIEKQINKIIKIIKKIELSIHSNLSIIDELKMWKELIKKRKPKSNNLNFQNTNLNSSVWENIKWISDSTQDVVFINHLLTKSNVNPYLILSEAIRITKNGWEIIVVNDVKTWKNEFLDLLENSSIKINHNDDKHKIWFRLIKN